MANEEYERILLVKNEIFIFKIPPRTTNRAVRASDWKLDAPDWTCRMKLVAKGDTCLLKIEDKASGQLFAKCPIDAYPGVAVEPVSDSSRYFVIRVQDDNGRSAFIGMGFADRGDSFDFNVSLQDHFKLAEKRIKLEQEDAAADSQPKLDLKFKEGETIKVNLNISKKHGAGNKLKNKVSGGPIGILPPPPGAIKIPGPPGNSTSNTGSIKATSNESSDFLQTSSKEDNDLLDDFESLSLSRSSQPVQQDITKIFDSNKSDNDLWADFSDSSTTTNSVGADNNQQQSNWASF
ncbi:NECAP-like protein CG9132 [Tetranychus urticae]|uniref:NECAP PHear domain-containing protein n=1 Tax=Tetranychus urticae TaxID=32264 RepID=T1KZ98_TETUR|nr:NECAP-like protein CG9132 [Tetranychus urticae]